MPEEHNLKFIKEKETTNTVRFKEQPKEGQPPKIGSLYLQKWFVGDHESVEVAIAMG